MTGNSSSVMMNAPPVTTQPAKDLLIWKHAVETKQVFLAPPPSGLSAECGPHQQVPGDAAAGGSSCDQLQTAIRHCFPVTSTAEGVPRSVLMLFIFYFLPSERRQGPGQGRVSGPWCLLWHQRVQPKARLRWSSPGNTVGYNYHGWTLSATFGQDKGIVLNAL